MTAERAAACRHRSRAVPGALALGFAWWPAPLAAQTASSAALPALLPAALVALAALGLAGFLLLRCRGAETRARLSRAALDALPHAVLLCDPSGATLSVNAAWRRRFGDAGAAPGEAALDGLAARLDDASALSRLREAAVAGAGAGEDCTLRDADGRQSRIRLSVRPADAAPGTQLWTVEDARIANALDRAVAAERSQMAGFLEDFPLGCFCVGADGRFLQANATFAQWLATTPEALVADGAKLADFLADGPAGANGAARPWCAAPGTGGDGPAVGEVTLRDRDGRRFLVRLSQTAIRVGDRTAALVLARDVSGERDLAAALRHAEARFHRFFDEAPVGIALVDPEGRIAESSKAFDRMAQAGAGGLAGRPLWACVDGDDGEQLRHWFDGAVATGEAAPLRVIFPAGNGAGEDADNHAVVASLFARRYESDDGGPGGVVVHALDQTERQNIETQFFQSQKMELVGQLAGGIAHDFNNLLTAMIGFCDLLLQRHSPKDQSFADIMQIKQNANRAANLVRQLLAFSRQQTLQPRVLDITDVLAELSHLLRRLIGASIELDMVHGRDLGLVKVDQSQLEQVIINLVVNARDAIGDGGRLAIRTRSVTASQAAPGRHQPLPAGDYVVLEVEDDGCGIAREHLDKIFEPFFTTKDVGSGTGLGLSTVYGIIKQTGGHIFVDSAPGKGTCFAIYLPRFEAGAEDRPGVAAPTAGGPPQARDLTGVGTVLLVEDEDAVRMFGARALRNKGYNVREAASGEDALILLDGGAADEIDVLITDVVMPGLDGPSMIRKVRETHPDMKVIFISGYTEDSFRQRLDSDEAVHFLPKPFTLEQLAGKVKEIMAEGRG